MRASGNSTKQMEKESSGMQMATSMRVTGKMIKLTAMEYMFT